MSAYPGSVSSQHAPHYVPRSTVHPQRPHRFESLDSHAVMTRCRRGQTICSEGRSAENWYRLKSGTAKEYVDRADGRRQIVDLLLPGNFFGFAAGEEYDFAVEAVTDNTVVACYPRRRIEMLAETDPQLAGEITAVAFEGLSRVQAQLLILGRVTAPKKVGAFLIELARRLSDGPERVVLPISRYDIADYLAISVETVSRSLTDLKHRGAIALSGKRCVKIVDRDALDG
jgi:CRP/FNR family transcriptional regulator, nitrogen fixation regulation protein